MMIKRVVGTAAVAGVAIFGGAGAFDDDTTRDASGEITEAGGLGVFAMQIGDCIQIPEETEIASLEAVPCATPHDAQVYSQPDVAFVGTYESGDEFYRAIGEACLPSFEGFVGSSYDDSSLYIDFFYPGPVAWEDGDRTITCVLIPADGEPQLTGDLEGSAL